MKYHMLVCAVPIRDVSAVKDGRAELPCDIQPPDSNDKVLTMFAILLSITIQDCSHDDYVGDADDY